MGGAVLKGKSTAEGHPDFQRGVRRVAVFEPCRSADERDQMGALTARKRDCAASISL